MEFVFELTKYNDISFKLQVSKALEKRTELVSRNKHPRLWKYTDKLNSKKKAPEQVLEKRRSRYKVYGIVLLLLGLFLLIPSLMAMAPKEMLIPLLVGAFTVGIGILNISFGIKSKKVKLTPFDKAAIQLFREYGKIPTGKVTFTNDKVQLVGNVTIDYSEIERIFITEDLFILIWNEKITVLQKKDLSSLNVQEFINFITLKSHHLFEVVNVA